MAEDSAHQRIAQRWVKRVVQDEVAWTRELLWEHVLTWRENAGRHFWKHSEVEKEQLPLRSRSTRRFGSGGPLEKPMFLRELVWATLLSDRPHVVVLARDMDGKPAKRRGFEAAKTDRSWPFPVLGLLPEPESEAWFIADFRPMDDHERERLRVCRQALGFDPTQKPHQLTSTTHGAKDAKHIARELLGDEGDMWERCLDAPFEELRRVGKETR